MTSRHQQGAFKFGPEAGAALRGIRERAGLSVEILARRMGRSIGYAPYLSRLERWRGRIFGTQAGPRDT